jgi:hypothetical protein
MIRVSVRKQYRVELWQRIERDSRRTHSGKKFPERGVKIGVGEKSFPADLN